MNRFRLFFALTLVLSLFACSQETPKLRTRGKPAARGQAKVYPVPEPRLVAGATVSAVWDKHYLDAALDVIKSARNTLSLTQFEFTYGTGTSEIQKALIAARRRGVKVTVILDDEPSTSAKTLPHLTRAGIDARLDRSKKRLHTKLIVADSRRVLFGSTNLSPASVLFNHETDLLIESPELGRAAEAYIAAIARDPGSDVVLAPVAVDGATVYFDRAFEEPLLELLAGSKRRILVQMYGTRYYENDPESPSTRALAELVAAKKRGLEVRVILERTNSTFGAETEDLNRATAEFLEAGGVEVRFDPPDVYSHAKLVIADGSATVGSMNWGFGGFRQYHEMNAIVTDPDCVGQLEKYFEAIWEQASAV